MLYFRKFHANSVSARYLTTVSAAALLLTLPIAARAADAPAAPSTTGQTAQAPAVEEIVVTGSRIVRNGYQAPTPVSVLAPEELQQSATINIADTVNRLPAFNGSTTQHNQSSTISTGTSGVNNLNLRGLGPNRTLVLLDGARVVGTTVSGFSGNGGAVDINAFPAGLVSRVDVVTGGASAAYGSDALAGVVNFVLDHNFTGIKGEVEGSVTTYGDDRGWKVNLTAGTPFGDGRGHFLIFGEINSSDGLIGNPRPWEVRGAQELANPAYTATNGQPQYIYRDQVGLATATPGGLITSGPLKGIYFGPGGTPAQLNYGLVSGNKMVGGDWQLTRIDQIASIDLSLEAKDAYTRLSYDLADNLEVFAQAQWSFTRTDNFQSVSQFHLGNLSVSATNPYLPAAVAAQMASLKLASATFGSTLADIGAIQAHTERTLRRYVFGADGKFSAFNTDWTWNAYYQRGETWVSAKVPNAVIEPRLRQAINSVRNANGAIVCVDPSLGCVPFNPFGIGVNSKAALNFVTAEGYGLTTLREDAAAATFNGEPFSSWAGPVSLATGIEWRREAVNGIVSALSDANSFFAGNFHNTVGHYSVVEGFAETVFPLARDTAWAKSLDLNAAVRATDYSVSGYVTTWKVGATYAPVDDVKFRVTRSRDIRAPSLGDLYNVGPAAPSTYFDRAQNSKPELIYSHLIGNTALAPEVADTTGLGVVLSPTFLPGFGASFDYYKIDISGAILALGTQAIIDRCFGGNQVLCSFITRAAPGPGQTIGDITNIDQKPANILRQTEDGYDIEASYKLALADIDNNWNGDLSFRLLATHITSLKTVDLDTVTEGAGVNSGGTTIGGGAGGALYAPAWRYTASASFTNDPIALTLTMRGIGAGTLDNSIVVCTSGCPTSTPTAPTADMNHVDGWKVFDVAFRYKFGHDENMEAFLTVENLTNQAPPVVPGNVSNGYYSGQGVATAYDMLGRFFHAGVRFKM